MPIEGIFQPDQIVISEHLRLRKYDGKYDFALGWYQDEETLMLVDGKNVPYDMDRLGRMYRYLNDHGELYFIEICEQDTEVCDHSIEICSQDKYRPIGDVTFEPQDMPIVIGEKKYRGKGIGRQVIRALVDRGRALGYEALYVDEIYHYNSGSKKMFESVGFVPYKESKNGMSYRLELGLELLEDTKKALPLFKDWPETLLWSCVRKTMGTIYADNSECPTSVMAILGDFCFFAGEPMKALVLYKPEWCTQQFIIMVPQNESWARLIEECYGSRAGKVTRYAFKKAPGVFDKDRLRAAMAALSPEFSLAMIDEEIFHMCRAQQWSRDLVSQFKDYEMYARLGIGVVALKDNVPVAGASSYTSYEGSVETPEGIALSEAGFVGGIEIEIDTRQDYRRRGLACACGAKLILECLERKLYPSWDAQNLWSVALAGKLGYHFSHEYTAYEIFEY